MKRLLCALAFSAALAAPAEAQQRVELGVLDCVVAGGAGFVIGSTKDLTCNFRPSGGRPAETYFGVVNKFGLDVGVTGATIIKWVVLGPDRRILRAGRALRRLWRRLR